METLLNVLEQQVHNSENMTSMLMGTVLSAEGIIKEEMSEIDKKAQIKSLMASANIYMVSLNSQDILIQQTIDKILELVNE